MEALLTGALAVVALAAVVAVAVSVSRDPAQPQDRPEPDPRPLCHPEDVDLPHPTGWPSWTICADSNGYYTCWRPAEHTGRHCAWDLSTGQVTAVWPCEQHPAITARRHQDDAA
jgi:hypothetical protein